MERLQRLADQSWSQIRATYADVHHVGDDGAGVSRVFTPVKPVSPATHAIPGGSHLRELVLQPLGSAGGPQQAVQGRAVLGVVDGGATQQLPDPARQVGLLRQLQ